MINALVSRTPQSFIWIPVAVTSAGGASLAWNQYGSVYGREWLPYAIGAGLLLSGLLWGTAAGVPTKPALVALASLLALAAWDAASIAWSVVPPAARDEALLVLLYAIVFATPLVSLRTAGARRVATAVAVGVLAAPALATFVHLLVTNRVTDDYENGRLTFPISYVNAQAAFFLLPFWPCIALASRRESRPWVRAGMTGAAYAMLAGWLMTQSKGGLVALVVSGIAFFVLAPNRLRAAVPAAIAVILLAASSVPLTRPYRVRFDSDFPHAIRTAAGLALALTLVGVLAGFAYAAADRRIELGRATRRRLEISVSALLAAALLGSVIAFFVVVRHPSHFASEKWDAFKTSPRQERGTSHLTSLGSNRYDFWRVELRSWQDHPVAGIGARGFGPEYLKSRRSDETPARGHSLELDVLSETGSVGLGLLALAICAALVRPIARARSDIVLAGLAAGAVYGFVHASGDWVWTFPAVGVPLFLLLGIANADVSVAEHRVIGKRPGLAAAVVVLVLALGGFGLPWLSARLTDTALRHRADATQDLKWARRLDPLSIDPFIAEATLARRPIDAVAALRRAAAKQPEVAWVHYRLGLAELAAGQRAAARADLARAQRLDPRSKLVRDALRRAGG